MGVMEGCLKVGRSIRLVVIWLALCGAYRMYSHLHLTAFVHKVAVIDNPLKVSCFRTSSVLNPFRRLRSKTAKHMLDDHTTIIDLARSLETSPNSTVSISAICTIDPCHNDLIRKECESSDRIVVNYNGDKSDGMVDYSVELTETESPICSELEPPISEAEFIETEDEENEEIVITEELTQTQSSIDLFCDLYDDISTEERQFQERQLSSDASQSRLFCDNHAGLWTGIYEVFIPTFVITTLGDEAVSEQLILRKWQSGAVQTSIVAGLAEDYLPEDNAQDVATTEIYTPLFTANPASFETTPSLLCQPSYHQQASGSKSFTCTSSTASPFLTDNNTESSDNVTNIAREPEKETQYLNLLQVTGFTPLEVESELCRATQTAFHPSSLRAIRGNQCVNNALTVSRCVEGSCSNGLIKSVNIEPVIYDESELVVIDEEQQDINNTKSQAEMESYVEEIMRKKELLSIDKEEEHENDEDEEEIVIGEDEQVVVMDNKTDVIDELNMNISYANEEIFASTRTLDDSQTNPELEENEDFNSTPNDKEDTLVSEECGSKSNVPKVYITELAVREDSLRTRVRFLYAPRRIATGNKSEKSQDDKRQEETSVALNPYDLYLVAFVVLREVTVSQLGSDGKIPFISPQELPYDRDQPGKSIYYIPFTAIGTTSVSENATSLENGTSSLSNGNSTQTMSGDYIEIALPGKLSLLFPRGVREGENASLTMQWTGEVRESSSLNTTSSIEEESNDAMRAVNPKQCTYQLNRYFSTLQNAAIDALEVSEVAETIPQTTN